MTTTLIRPALAAVRHAWPRTGSLAIVAAVADGVRCAISRHPVEALAVQEEDRQTAGIRPPHHG